jgi:hypothetical protein
MGLRGKHPAHDRVDPGDGPQAKDTSNSAHKAYGI